MIKTLALALAASLSFTACDKKPEGSAAAPKDSAPAAPVVDEKTAIATFKNEVEAVGKWIEEKQKSNAANPAAAMALMGEAIGKFKAISTSNLPADLKGTWDELTGVLGEMGEAFKGMPSGQPENPEAAMKALGELMPKMAAIEGKMKPIAEKLEELGKKYGIDMSKAVPK